MNGALEIKVFVQVHTFLLKFVSKTLDYSSNIAKFFLIIEETEV